MSIMAQNTDKEVAILDCVHRFFSKHHMGELLKKCNGTKEKGVPAISLLRYRLENVFADRSMYMQMRTGSFKENFSKNTVYRFLNSAKTNWLKFTTALASTIINDEVKNLTDEKRSNVFILDDTLFNRISCKRTELGSKVFDHTNMRYKKGFRLLTLGWSDGNTFLPVNSCLMASSKEANIIGSQKDFDKRSIAGKRRKLAQMKATDIMLQLLDMATAQGITADYVLFDSWFSNPILLSLLQSSPEV